MIDTIYFIGDHYRGGQNRNVQILHGIISPVFFELDVHVEVLTQTSQYADFERWVRSLEQIGASALDDYKWNNSAVIGFEMNPIDIAYLNRKKIPWIDFEIHPIRFLDDLHFSIKSSFLIDFTEISTSKSQIKFAANYLNLKYMSQSEILQDNALLIVGQSPQDKSVFFDGEFKSLASYMDKLSKIVEQYEHIYFRAHPYVSDPYINETITKEFNAVELNQYSYYQMLSSRNLKAVCGISSSCLHEADYFGKKAYFLEPRAKKFSPPVRLKSILDSMNKWISALLQVEQPVVLQSYNTHDNLCRELYGYWSYPKSNINSCCNTDGTKVQSIVDSSLLYSSPSFLCHTKKGFHATEPWGVWSAGKASSISIEQLEPISQTTIVRVTFDMKIYHPVSEYSPVCEIRYGENRVKYALFRENMTHIENIELQFEWNDKISEIYFESTHQDSPMEHGSKDERILSFGIERFCVEIMPSEQTQMETEKLFFGI